jgi:hypothetical protein
VKEKYGLTAHHLFVLGDCFRKADRKSAGSVDAGDLLAFLDEEDDCILRPYADYMVELFKSEQDRVEVVQWVDGVCSFCLSTQENLVKLMFGLLDRDFDEVISKKDIVTFMAGEHRPLFFKNDFEVVQWLEVERPEHIKLDQFKKLIRKMWFLIFPLIILHEKLQDYVGGRGFWQALFDFKQSDERKNKVNNKDQLDFEEKKRRKQIETRIEQLKEKFAQEPYRRTLAKQAFLESRGGRLHSDSNLLAGGEQRARRTASDLYLKAC